MPALLIVDGDNLAHRAYHSTPKTVTDADGQPINAIAGFVRMLIRVWERESPRGVFVAWDSLGVDTYRNELWPPYQTGRVFEPSIVRQLGLMPDLCKAFGFGVGKGEGYEADDLMASAAQEEVRRAGTCLLLTTDRDSFQLVSDRVTVLSPKPGGKEPDRIDPVEVVRRLGVLPEQVPDFKALAGDPSDKIPGIRGIGPKGAASLLLRHGSLEQVLAAWDRPEDVDRARLFRKVVQMRTDAPVELPSGPPDWLGGAKALRAMGAERLAGQAADLG